MVVPWRFMTSTINNTTRITALNGELTVPLLRLIIIPECFWGCRQFFVINFVFSERLLSCDWKVTGSSPGNSHLCKKQGKAAYNTPIMVGPLPGPCVCGSFSALGCPLPLTSFFQNCVRGFFFFLFYFFKKLKQTDQFRLHVMSAKCRHTNSSLGVCTLILRQQ